MLILSQIFNWSGAASSIIGIQLKAKRNILIALMLSGIFYGTGLLLGAQYSGAIICLLGALQTLISFILTKKNIPFPKWLVVVYLIIAIACGVATYGQIYDILPAATAVLYVFSLIQSKEKNIRRIILCIIVLWIIYGTITRVYPMVISDTINAASAIIAIVKYDIIAKRKKAKLLDASLN